MRTLGLTLMFPFASMISALFIVTTLAQMPTGTAVFLLGIPFIVGSCLVVTSFFRRKK